MVFFHCFRVPFRIRWWTDTDHLYPPRTAIWITICPVPVSHLLIPCRASPLRRRDIWNPAPCLWVLPAEVGSDTVIESVWHESRFTFLVISCKYHVCTYVVKQRWRDRKERNSYVIGENPSNFSGPLKIQFILNICDIYIYIPVNNIIIY